MDNLIRTFCAQVVQWVNCWPTDLIPRSILTRGGNPLTVNRVPLRTAFLVINPSIVPCFSEKPGCHRKRSMQMLINLDLTRAIPYWVYWESEVCVIDLKMAHHGHFNRQFCGKKFATILYNKNSDAFLHLGEQWAFD